MKGVPFRDIKGIHCFIEDTVGQTTERIGQILFHIVQSIVGFAEGDKLAEGAQLI